MGSKTVNQQQTLTPEEQELTRIQAELAKKQSAMFDEMLPFQRELLTQSLADLKRQEADSAAMDAAVTPEQRAALAKQDYERAVRLGPIQDQILDMQMANMRGELTPGQKASADAAIQAAHGDIDVATQEGIGLISDELANSRGLRLSDSPILREATALAETGLQQKSRASANIRASALSTMPQVSSAIGAQQQNLAGAAQAFQTDLRQRAFQNRMMLSGQTSQSGIGLSSIRTPGATGAGSSQYGKTSGVSTGEWGQIASGIGMAMLAFSDRRLKDDIVKVGEDDRGIGIYEYTKFGRRKRGLMADEVAAISPGAVSVHPSGYKVVDYRKI